MSPRGVPPAGRPLRIRLRLGSITIGALGMDKHFANIDVDRNGTLQPAHQHSGAHETMGMVIAMPSDLRSVADLQHHCKRLLCRFVCFRHTEPLLAIGGFVLHPSSSLRQVLRDDDVLDVLLEASHRDHCFSDMLTPAQPPVMTEAEITAPVGSAQAERTRLISERTANTRMLEQSRGASRSKDASQSHPWPPTYHEVLDKDLEEFEAQGCGGWARAVACWSAAQRMATIGSA